MPNIIATKLLCHRIAVTWKRYIAVGDSFTEGLDDLQSNGLFRGWADRVAETLATHDPDFTYANLAIRGKKFQSIVDEQLERALAEKPDLVSINGGGNDLLRPKWDSAKSTRELEAAVATVRQTGADVLLISFCAMGGHSRSIGLIDQRTAIMRENLLRIAEKYDCYVADLWGAEIFDDKRAWSPDRLHMNATGHQRVAEAVLQALGLGDSSWRLPLPPSDPPNVIERLTHDLSWAYDHLRPWVMRRLKGTSSGDDLTPKREVPHRVRTHKS